MAVICIAAALVLGVLGIFSAKYRALAKEAFHCAARTMTLRKCDTQFDEKIKAGLAGSLGRISPQLGGMAFKHFGILSAVFVILMAGSTIAFVWGGWNYYQYGNCNGPESTDFCIFDPTGTGEHGFSRIAAEQNLTHPQNTNGIQYGNSDAKLIVYEYGCFACPYTKMAEPAVAQLREEYKDRVLFVFKVFPIPKHPHSLEAAHAAYAAQAQGKYWEMHGKLFEYQKEFKEQGMPVFDQIANEIGINIGKMHEHMQDKAFESDVNALYQEGSDIGIYGTPTFFIGEQHFVGHVTYEELKKAIEEELAKVK